MKIKNLLLLALFLTTLVSCEKYEDYMTDYDYSIVYFATQKPLRTIVGYENMDFKVGVALGGKRENNEEEYAEFIVDPSLLDDETLTEGNDFKLLPASYYTLSDDKRMVIPEGEFIGDVTVSLNREAFTSDSLATENTYALPLRITKTSADSIASGKFGASGNALVKPKDYTILVVKYISPYHGTYYHKGQQNRVDTTGAVIETVTYWDKDLSRNQTWELSTLELNKVKTSGIGDKNNGSLILEVEEGSNSVEVTSGKPAFVVSGSGTYDESNRAFYLNYDYKFQNKNYMVMDTLILRRPPEQDLFFEEW